MSSLRSFGLAALLACGVAFAASAAADPAKFTVVEPPADLEAMLMKGDFDALDKLADDYRASHVRLKGGDWALERIYYMMSAIKQTDCDCGGARGAFGFDEKRQALERWLAAKPKSVTARLSLAALWQNYAGIGRGGAYGQETSEAQWKAYHDRMARARDILQPVDPDADPKAYSLALDMVPESEPPRATLDELYARATKAFPDYPEFAAIRYQYLQERWFGGPGEATQFLQSLAKDATADDGLIAYFTVAVTGLSFERNYPVVFQSTGVDYGTLVKAFVTRSKDVGLSNRDLNAMMFYAVAARDKKTAALLAHKIDGDWDRWLWREQGAYDATVAWTTQWP